MYQNNNFQSKIIDKEEALNRLGRNEKLYNKVLHDFYQRYKHNNNFNLEKKDLREQIHNLSGLSGTIGAMKLNMFAQKTLKETNKKNLLKLNKELLIVLEAIKIETSYKK